MTWVHRLSAELEETADLLGSKGYGLVQLHRLGLPVPPGFVIGADACREFLRDGALPIGLADEVAVAVADLEAETGRTLGGSQHPLVVSVRSGASISMPGMMDTVLDLGLTTAAMHALATETGSPRFALDSRLRFLASFASAVLGVGTASIEAVQRTAAARHDVSDEDRLGAAIHDLEGLIRQRTGERVPGDASQQLRLAIEAVFSSWDTPRARAYRDLHDIPSDLGTAVTVQAMVFGNRDDDSGSGVAFSRNPMTGERMAYGDMLFGCQGEDVVSGRLPTRQLDHLAERLPTAWSTLVDALSRIEKHYRQVCEVEFTVESGRLWVLQVRPANLVGRAAIRVAVDLADEGVLTRTEALLRIAPAHVRHAGTPRVDVADPADILTRGLGASPGVACGRVAVTADTAVRMAADGPVILVRPETSPLDMHGIGAAAGIVTGRGGATSHAAVVARAMAKPAVVSAADLTVDPAGACVRAGSRRVSQGAMVTIDGTTGEVVVGSARVTTGAADPHLLRLLDWADNVAGPDSTHTDAERLVAAQTVIRRDHDVAG